MGSSMTSALKTKPILNRDSKYVFQSSDPNTQGDFDICKLKKGVNFHQSNPPNRGIKLASTKKPASRILLQVVGFQLWAQLGSNQRPPDYESDALTC